MEGLTTGQKRHQVIGPYRRFQVAQHVDAIHGGVELDRTANDNAGMDDRRQHERSAHRPDDQVDHGRNQQVHDQAQLIVEPVHPDNHGLVLQPHGDGTLHVFPVAPEDPADPCPALGLKRVVRVAGCIGKAVMLGMVVHPVLHIALHRNNQVQHGDELRRGVQLTRPVLQDTVKRANTGIAQEDRQRGHTKGQREIPPVQRQLAERDPEDHNRGEQCNAKCRVTEGGKETCRIEGFPRFRDGQRTRYHRCCLQIGRRAGAFCKAFSGRAD